MLFRSYVGGPWLLILLSVGRCVCVCVCCSKGEEMKERPVRCVWSKTVISRKDVAVKVERNDQLEPRHLAGTRTEQPSATERTHVGRMHDVVDSSVHVTAMWLHVTAM